MRDCLTTSSGLAWQQWRRQDAHEDGQEVVAKRGSSAEDEEDKEEAHPMGSGLGCGC